LIHTFFSGSLVEISDCLILSATVFVIQTMRCIATASAVRTFLIPETLDLMIFFP
jgi:hypothetical protein